MTFLGPGDRVPIDAALVRRLVAQQHPRWAGLPVEQVLPGGNDNRTFRLGDEHSVRLPSAEGYAAAVEKEQRWLPHLAPHLPVAIPEPVALGRPTPEYPFGWSILRWIDGATATPERVPDPAALAADVGSVSRTLRGVDAAGGPAAGAHSFHRGAPPVFYDRATREAADIVADEIDRSAALAVWDAALESRWEHAPVWFHGDIAWGNLLVRDGRLAALIDWGTSGVGDPASDLAIAWTMFEGPSRLVFREAVGLDAATWARGRGWTLWKTLIVLAEARGGGRDELAAADDARRVLREVLADPIA